MWEEEHKKSVLISPMEKGKREYSWISSEVEYYTKGSCSLGGGLWTGLQ